MADRKAELEAKRQRLNEIRQNKKKKEANSHLNIPSAAHIDSISTEDLLKSLGISNEKSISNNHEIDKLRSDSQPILNNSPSQSAPSHVKPKKKKNLTRTPLIETVILPPESISYDKECQADIESPQRNVNTKSADSMSADYYVLTYEEDPTRVDADAALKELERMPHVGLTQSTMSRSVESSRGKGGDNELISRPFVMSEEERDRIMSSDSFIRFFQRASRVIERAIDDETDDVLLDYAGASDDDGTARDHDDLVIPTRQFYHERWCKRRTVNALDWSTEFPELVLASYQRNSDDLTSSSAYTSSISHSSEPDGLCLVWNIKYSSKMSPEYILTCQSTVTSASLSRFHPNIIVGGTYCGQVVVWDNRVNKRTPIQRSPVNSQAHTYSVVSVDLVGSTNAHNLISLGADGSLCSWQLDMLSQPVDKVKLVGSSSSSSHLHHPSTGSHRIDIYPSTRLSFFANNVNSYALGAESGLAYCGQRHSSSRSSSSNPSSGDRVALHTPYLGHCAPLTGLSTHACPGQLSSASNLFLTSSLDLTVRMWSASQQRPLTTFDVYSDYVLDVAWSPSHPAVFASVDASGLLAVWNLNQEIEIPRVQHAVGAVHSSSNTTNSLFSSPPSDASGQRASDHQSSSVALNKCRWDQSGQFLACGDDAGRVTVVSVADSLSQPSSDEWQRFGTTLAEIETEHANQNHYRH